MRAAAIGLLLTLVNASSTLACSCGSRANVPEALATAEVVFLGTVVDVERKTPVIIEFVRFAFGKVRSVFGGKDYDPFDDENYGRAVTFNVARSFKGVSEKRVVISTGFGGGDCGIDFEPGKSYLVYAYGKHLNTGICSRTKPADQAGDDLSILTTPSRPNFSAAADAARS